MNPPPHLVVAIDGPSGAGKTAAGMILAERLGAVFVDTGIFYRALTLLALRRGVSTTDAAALAALVPAVSSRIATPAGGCRVAEVQVEGEAVGDAIRSPEVEEHVSEVASHSEVRTAIVEIQRGAANGEPGVVAGRDIGTVIFPNAPVKVYLDASPAQRALRRARQLGALAQDVEVAQSLAARDARDTGRAVAPLARAADAMVIDTDELTLEQVVDTLDALVRRTAKSADADR